MYGAEDAEVDLAGEAKGIPSGFLANPRPNDQTNVGRSFVSDNTPGSSRLRPTIVLQRTGGRPWLTAWEVVVGLGCGWPQCTDEERTMKGLAAVFFSTVTIVGCGTTSSIEPESAVPHAVIEVNDSLVVTGKILLEDDKSVTIAVAGGVRYYGKSEVKSLKRVMLPDEDLMLQEIVSNSSKAASNTGFLVGWLVVALLAGFGAVVYVVASE